MCVGVFLRESWPRPLFSPWYTSIYTRTNSPDAKSHFSSPLRRNYLLVLPAANSLSVCYVYIGMRPLAYRKLRSVLQNLLELVSRVFL